MSLRFFVNIFVSSVLLFNICSARILNQHSFYPNISMHYFPCTIDSWITHEDISGLIWCNECGFINTHTPNRQYAEIETLDIFLLEHNSGLRRDNSWVSTITNKQIYAWVLLKLAHSHVFSISWHQIIAFI